MKKMTIATSLLLVVVLSAVAFAYTGFGTSNSGPDPPILEIAESSVMSVENGTCVSLATNVLNAMTLENFVSFDLIDDLREFLANGNDARYNDVYNVNTHIYYVNTESGMKFVLADLTQMLEVELLTSVFGVRVEMSSASVSDDALMEEFLSVAELRFFLVSALAVHGTDKFITAGVTSSTMFVSARTSDSFIDAFAFTDIARGLNFEDIRSMILYACAELGTTTFEPTVYSSGASSVQQRSGPIISY